MVQRLPALCEPLELPSILNFADTSDLVRFARFDCLLNSCIHWRELNISPSLFKMELSSMKRFLCVCCWSSVFSASPQNRFIQIIGFCFVLKIFFPATFAPRRDPAKAFWPRLCCHIRRESAGAKLQFWDCSLTENKLLHTFPGCSCPCTWKLHRNWYFWLQTWAASPLLNTEGDLLGYSLETLW